jgi:hypothetical protein
MELIAQEHARLFPRASSGTPMADGRRRNRPPDRQEFRFLEGADAGLEIMEVVGADRRFVGLATCVRDRDFLLCRSMLRAAYVPLSAVRRVTQDNRIVLALPAHEVELMGWPNPFD